MERTTTQRDYEALIAHLQDLEIEREEAVDDKLNNFHGAQAEQELFALMKARDHAMHQIAAIRKRLADVTMEECIAEPDCICVGDRVQLESVETASTQIVHIVAAPDPQTPDAISFDSPLAHALLGQAPDCVITLDDDETQHRIVAIAPMPQLSLS